MGTELQREPTYVSDYGTHFIVSHFLESSSLRWNSIDCSFSTPTCVQFCGFRWCWCIVIAIAAAIVVVIVSHSLLFSIDLQSLSTWPPNITTLLTSKGRQRGSLPNVLCCYSLVDGFLFSCLMRHCCMCDIHCVS